VIESGGGQDKVAAINSWRESPLFTDEEQLVLEYGERMTITGETVDDAFFDQLKAHFSEAQIVELTAGIAMENFRSKFNAPLRVTAQGFCVLPKS
jgi:alkylhydroperoxidase family enzyme